MAWEAFEREDIHIFETTGSEALRSRWKGYISNIKGEIAKLRSYKVRLHQDLVLFEGLKAGVS
jgi:hypothetical protein